jgi:hypothetical protein
MSADVEMMIFKEYGFLKGTHILWKTLREKYSISTASQD